jgi:hypothetical protein
MGFWTAMKHIGRGEFRYGFDAAFIPEEEIERSEDLDRRLNELNMQDRDEGQMTDAEFRDRQARISANAFPSYDSSGRIFDQGTDPWSGFKEGLGDGVTNIKQAVTATTSTVFGAVPWQLWAVLGVYIFIMAAPYLLRRKA